MTLLKDIEDYIESIAPVELQESYDNSGLQVGSYNQQIRGVLICLDCTEAVVDESLKKECNLIITHHPVIFRGIKKINGDSFSERVIIKAVKNDIAIYTVHTNLDNILSNGVNEAIAKKLGICNYKILLPKGKTEYGSGIIGELSVNQTEKDFLSHIKKTMRVGCLRHTALRNKNIKMVAICGGSGSFLLQEAIKQGSDIFISADFKYHQFFDAENIVIADIGHYESEQFTQELLYEILTKKFTTFAIKLSEINTNPVFYF